MSLSQRRSVLTLLLKDPEGDPKELSNYRPISVTNTDFKLFSSVLANRVQTVLKDIIQHRRKAFKTSGAIA